MQGHLLRCKAHRWPMTENVRNSARVMIRRQVAILGLKIFRGLRYIRRGVPTITASVFLSAGGLRGDLCWFGFGLD